MTRIKIGSYCFPTKAAAAEKIRSILNEWSLGTRLEWEAYDLILALLFCHPKAGQKVGSGVRGIRVDKGPPPWGSRCFIVERTDGTETDFSYKECLSPSSHRADVLTACRQAVDTQILNVKSGTVGVHAHHDEISFLELVESWLAERGLTYDKIELVESVDNSASIRFKNEAVGQDFQAYHQERAKLKVLTVEEHKAAHRESAMITLSPTAVSKYRLCRRAYAFEYNEGLRAPSTVKQQFGTDVHAQIERWLRNGQEPDDTPEGRTARQGLQWLPKPDPRLLLEQHFIFAVTDEISAGGIIDCLVPPEVTGGELLLIDQKTTSDLRWAKTEEQLEADPQTLIYAVWGMLTWQAPAIRARWVYYAATNGEPREPHGSKPVEIRLTAQGIRASVEQLVADFEEMAKIRREKQPGMFFLPSPESCSMFGGCPHRQRCNLSPGDRLAAYINKDKIV